MKPKIIQVTFNSAGRMAVVLDNGHVYEKFTGYWSLMAPPAECMERYYEDRSAKETPGHIGGWLQQRAEYRRTREQG